MTKQRYFSGTSGLALTVPKRLYPPEYQDKSRLHYYASLFNSLEINSSFYTMPRAITINKWTASVSPGFQFTFKLARTITHNKGLVFDAGEVNAFIETINLVDERKGCLLLQFPPSLTIAVVEQLEKLLQVIKKADPGHAWKIAVEFRNKSWYVPEIYEMLLLHNTALVVHDHPSSATPVTEPDVDFVYLRFHGPGGGYRGSYSDAFLEDHARQIRGWLKNNKSVYVYFNNTMGDAAKNLLTLNELVRTIL